MKNNFFTHITKWIDSYTDIDALEWLRKFIDLSNQPEDIKIAARLYLQQRISYINSFPKFKKVHDDIYLMDGDGLPDIFNRKFTAVKKIAELRQRGFSATIMEDHSYYRIRLTNPALINPTSIF